MWIGTYYRYLLWKRLGIQTSKQRVLEIGGFDGYWLSKQPAEIKVCVDLRPKNDQKNVIYVRANALALPFRDNYFDQAFAFEVIEHIVNDKQFLKEIRRVTKPNGSIIMSTPHKYFSVFPRFLTNWQSRKLGHHRKRGYLISELNEIIPESDVAEFQLIRSSFFRFFYFPLRLMWKLSEICTKPIVGMIAYLDSIFLKGENGFVIIYITKGS